MISNLDTYTKADAMELLRKKVEEYEKSAQIQITLLEKAKEIRLDIQHIQEHLAKTV